MKAFMVVFPEDRDADSFAADILARMAGDGSSSVLVDYGTGYADMGRDARALVVPFFPVTPESRPADVPDVRNETWDAEVLDAAAALTHRYGNAEPNGSLLALTRDVLARLAARARGLAGIPDAPWPRPGSVEEQIRQSGDELRGRILRTLAERGPATGEQVAAALKEPGAVVLVQCRDMAGRGQLWFDVATGAYSLPAEVPDVRNERGTS